MEPTYAKKTSMACYSRTDVVCGIVARTGMWEPELIRIFDKLNNRVMDKIKRPTFIDIGANVGSPAIGSSAVFCKAKG